MDYNDYAKNYAVYRSAYPWIIEPIASEIKLLSMGSTIVEIGCGTGNYIISISKKLQGYAYKGFDLSKEMLSVAHSRSDAIEFSWGNADISFPYGDEVAECTFLVDVVQHITNYSVFFHECSRILKPYRNLIIITDSEENMKKRSLTKYFPEILEIELKRYPKINELNRYAINNGLTPISSELAEGFIEIDKDFVQRVQNKFSSAMRLMKDEDHKRGVERVVEAKSKGEKWFSSYTVLKYKKLNI